MPTAWRILKRRHVASAFDGEGARRFGGRWNSPGTAVVNSSGSRALALLEVLAGLRAVRPLEAYVMLPATFDDALVLGVETSDLPPEWRRHPPPPETQNVGNDWVDKRASVVLRVPSVIVPEECNYLLNPAHPNFRQVRIGSPEEVNFDPRLVPR
jgi:RES domain-containing protein